jgi:hypothetical protein
MKLKLLLHSDGPLKKCDFFVVNPNRLNLFFHSTRKKIFPGFSIPVGSKACFTFFIKRTVNSRGLCTAGPQPPSSSISVMVDWVSMLD